MYKKNFCHRIISIICSSAILLTSCLTPAFAANKKSDIDSCAGYSYEIEWHNDTDFTLRGYVNDELYDEVSGSLGGEKLTVRIFGKSDSENTTTISGPVVQELTVSDYITTVSDETTPDMEDEPSAIAYNTYAGYVQYRVLADQYYYYPLYIYYDIESSVPLKDEKITVPEGMSLTQIAGIILSATGAVIPVAWVSVVVVMLGGILSTGILTNSISGQFTGTKYNYNLKAENRTVSPTISKTYSGTAFNGRIRKGNEAWKDTKLYDGYYPQFIREKDTAVANWLFNDFFVGTYDISRWYSVI